jgi:hypothetical protein
VITTLADHKLDSTGSIFTRLNKTHPTLGDWG